MKMPGRYVALDFSIDTNRINAMQKCPATNQLESWHKDGVIQIEMCGIAQDEAREGKGSAARYQKTSDHYYYGFQITLDSHRHSDEFRKIKDILFPNKSNLTKKEANDVIIVFHAKDTSSTLVTDEGGSKRQPGGMLGNRERLFDDIGVKVMRDTEAVELVNKKIMERDQRERTIANRTGDKLPDWVGKDLKQNLIKES